MGHTNRIHQIVHRKGLISADRACDGRRFACTRTFRSLHAKQACIDDHKMWGLVPDLSKLGSSLGEALQKAKDDMEKNIDSSLGIGGAMHDLVTLQPICLFGNQCSARCS